MFHVNQLIGFGSNVSQPIQYVGGQVDSNAGASGTKTINFSLTGGLASTPNVGDMVIVAVAYGSTNTNRDLSVSGYTEISDMYAGTASSSDWDSNFGVFYKFLTAAETSVDVPLSGDAAQGSAYAIHVWRNVNQSTPLDVAKVEKISLYPSSALPLADPITPVTPGAVIIVAAGTDVAGADGRNFTSGDLSNFVTTFASDTNESVIGMGSFAWVSGTFTPVRWAGPVSFPEYQYSALTIALRPE
jgi:hypothetical protein